MKRVNAHIVLGAVRKKCQGLGICRVERIKDCECSVVHGECRYDGDSLIITIPLSQLNQTVRAHFAAAIEYPPIVSSDLFGVDIELKNDISFEETPNGVEIKYMTKHLITAH